MSRQAPGEGLSPARRLLEARAALVARRGRTAAGDGAAAEEGRDLLVLRRGRIRFALPLEAAAEVRWVLATPLPVAAARRREAVVQGFFAMRDRALSVVDLLPLLDNEAPAESLPKGQLLVVVLSSARGELGLRLDEILGPRKISTGELGRVEVDLGKSLLLSALTTDLVHVLDPDRLVAHPRIAL